MPIIAARQAHLSLLAPIVIDGNAAINKTKLAIKQTLFCQPLFYLFTKISLGSHFVLLRMLDKSVQICLRNHPKGAATLCFYIVTFLQLIYSQIMTVKPPELRNAHRRIQPIFINIRVRHINLNH